MPEDAPNPYLLIEQMAPIIETQHGHIRVLEKTLEEAREDLSNAQFLTSQLVSAVHAEHRAYGRRDRWQLAIALAAVGAGLICVLFSSWLQHGFGQLLLEVSGGALLTYVLVDRVVATIGSIPDEEIRARESVLQNMLQVNDVASRHISRIVEVLASSPTLPDLPHLPIFGTRPDSAKDTAE